MLDLLRTYLRPPPSGVVYECRECGRDVDGPAGPCPACDGTDIARFEVD